MRRTRSSLVALATVAALSLTSCASLLMDFRVSLDPQELSLPPGGEGEVTITVSQLVPVDTVPMSISVALHDAPDYVISDPELLIFPSGITSDELTIRVAEDAPTGTTESIEVRASNGIKTKELTFELTIAGP